MAGREAGTLELLHFIIVFPFSSHGHGIQFSQAGQTRTLGWVGSKEIYVHVFSEEKHTIQDF